jgi:tRNA threonylcarbamoyladenosine biosynthesis protein TsaB
VLLALDTATTTASLAVYDLTTDQLLGEWTWQARRRQTQDLLTTARTLLTQLQRTPRDLTALAVTTGPGSFTGVRIAISVAKGMAVGSSAPLRVIGVPTLAVTAAPWLVPAGASDPPALVCAYIQAGRGRYNWLLFEPDDLLRRPGAEEHGFGRVDEFTDALAATDDRPLWLVGESTAELLDAVAGLPWVTALDGVSGLRRAGQLARVAALHLARGEADDLATLQPLYLRKPG